MSVSLRGGRDISSSLDQEIRDLLPTRSASRTPSSHRAPASWQPRRRERESAVTAAGLTIGARTWPVLDRPVTIPLLHATVLVNERIVTADGALVRGLRVESPFGDVVVSEAAVRAPDGLCGSAT
jgi:hypothetical protein